MNLVDWQNKKGVIPLTCLEIYPRNTRNTRKILCLSPAPRSKAARPTILPGLLFDAMDRNQAGKAGGGSRVTSRRSAGAASPLGEGFFSWVSCVSWENPQ